MIFLKLKYIVIMGCNDIHIGYILVKYLVKQRGTKGATEEWTES